jgi:6-phosphogluconolactonase
MVMEIETARTADEIAARAAEWIAAHLRTAVEERGAAHLAVSGGSTPGLMFSALAGLSGVPWPQVHIWQVDERVAPKGSPDRNLTQLRRDLLRRVPVPSDQVHPMPVEEADLTAAAAAHAAELHDVCDGVLDIVHLGLGDDGHTASWPPHHPVLNETSVDVAVVGPFHGVLRMTLTPAAVNRARDVMLLVTGRDKAQVLSQLLGGDQSLPASRVRKERTVLMAGGGAEAGTVAWTP